MYHTPSDLLVLVVLFIPVVAFSAALIGLWWMCRDALEPLPRAAALLLLPFVAACGPRLDPPTPRLLTNEEIIAETQKCEAGGLDGALWVLIDGYGKRGAVRVTCEPRKHTK